MFKSITTASKWSLHKYRWETIKWDWQQKAIQQVGDATLFSDTKIVMQLLATLTEAEILRAYRQMEEKGEIAQVKPSYSSHVCHR